MTDNERFTHALIFAARKHEHQIRREGTPYNCHPVKVALLLKDAGYGIDYQIAALLHDVLEDTDATEEEVGFYGAEILKAVKLVTRPEGAREEDYVAAILENPMAAMVKSCDIINNMYDAAYTADKDWARRYIHKAWVYDYGKFTPATTDAIITAGKAVEMGSEAPRRFPAYTREQLTLYSELEKRT